MSEYEKCNVEKRTNVGHQYWVELTELTQQWYKKYIKYIDHYKISIYCFQQKVKLLFSISTVTIGMEDTTEIC